MVLHTMILCVVHLNELQLNCTTLIMAISINRYITLYFYFINNRIFFLTIRVLIVYVIFAQKSYMFEIVP